MESVWDYPRPPRLERTTRRLRVLFAGELIADTTNGWRLLETSHPPAYYIPPADVRTQFLHRIAKRSFCEFKGTATYWDLQAGNRTSSAAAWSYESPTHVYLDLANHLCFYAGRADECYVDDLLVIPQPGDFYGGWITPDLKGPFKGIPGSAAW